MKYTLIISIMNLRTTLIVFLCFCATTVLRAERVDMLKAGAKANGKTLNTKLHNQTACSHTDFQENVCAE